MDPGVEAGEIEWKAKTLAHQPAMDSSAEQLSFSDAAQAAARTRSRVLPRPERGSWGDEELRIWEARIREHLSRPLVRLQLALKRGVDVLGSLGLLLVLSPLLLVTALAVRMSSPGPIFFTHLRWARYGEKFRCYKFRSMRRDGDRTSPETAEQKAERLEKERAGTLHKVKHDPRITKVGAWIRRTSVDELPQLLNVLRGDMTLVGPRPLVLPMMEPYPEIRRVRCLMRPGLTGLWQIRARADNTSVLGMMPHDLEYLAEFSLWLDLKILAKTAPAVLGGHGAV